jgi:hypothetical protein
MASQSVNETAAKGTKFCRPLDQMLFKRLSLSKLAPLLRTRQVCDGLRPC